MKEIISATNAPAALGPYSHAVAMEGVVFTSGQLGIDPATGKLAEGVAAQAEQALKNLEAVLKAAGASMADVVKTTVFVKDLADFGTVNTIYGQHFGADFPPAPACRLLRFPQAVWLKLKPSRSRARTNRTPSDRIHGSPSGTPARSHAPL